MLECWVGLASSFKWGGKLLEGLLYFGIGGAVLEIGEARFVWCFRFLIGTSESFSSEEFEEWLDGDRRIQKNYVK